MSPSPSLLEGFGALLHLLHYALFYGGLGLGLVLLVLTAPRRTPSTPRRAHPDPRVQTLLDRVDAGLLTTLEPARPTAPRTATPWPEDARTAREPSAVPLLLVGSTAAAGVHAAAAPAHLGEGPLVAGFFVACALAQLGWSVAVLVVGPRRSLLVGGLALNAAVLALWALTRTLGLPWGLAPVEPVGAWDLAAAGWETVVVVGCGLALRDALPERVARSAGGRAAPGWRDPARWSPAARAWLAGSAALLVLLPLAGAPT